MKELFRYTILKAMILLMIQLYSNKNGMKFKINLKNLYFVIFY